MNKDKISIEDKPTCGKPLLAVRTNSELDKQRIQMAYKGYYLSADIAKLRGVSRQHIGRLVNENKFTTSHAFGRLWLKYDDGELAKELYNEVANPLSIFSQFGFKQRMRSLVVSEDVVCDIKLLDGLKKIVVRFYDEQGNMLQLLSDISTSEFITDDCQV